MLDDFGTQQPSPQATREPPRASAVERRSPHERRQPISRLIQWTGHGPDRYFACEQTWPVLPGGVYSIEMDDGRIIFVNQPLAVDSLFYFTDSIGDRLIQEIETFWDSADKYAEHGFRHRRGYLLYGPQGSGKSSIVQQTISRITNRGGIVFLCNTGPEMLSKALQNFRLVEPARPVLCIFEDIDAIIQRHGDSDILSLLDGESQIDFVLNLATTNYPEKLDKRIVSRPRRFDRIQRVDMPNEKVRRAYFAWKLPDASEEEIEHLVDVSEDFSFAGLAEIIISVRCLGKDEESVLTTLREMHKRHPSSREYEGANVGFGGPR